MHTTNTFRIIINIQNILNKKKSKYIHVHNHKKQTNKQEKNLKAQLETN
jgi:hypothetical protein